MEGLRAYEMYLAVKLHFTTDYDFFKYQGKVRSATEKSFLKRKDRIHFVRLERRYRNDTDLRNFLVANFMWGDKAVWVGELFSPGAEKVYANWKQRQESFSYLFREDLKRIVDAKTTYACDNIVCMFKANSDDHPPVLKMYIAGRLGVETLIAIDKIASIFKVWDDKITEKYVWPQLHKRIENCIGFLALDVDTIKRIMEEELK